MTDSESESEPSKVQADHDSFAVGGNIEIQGVQGSTIHIGHTGLSAEQVSALLTQITTGFKRKPFDGRCPYKGLEFFEEEDAELFFGREALVADLLRRVRESRAVFITGPSGSGKSSLVRAGLIHALKQGAIPNSQHWLYETMRPGREPLRELALAFSRLKSPELENYFLSHASEAGILSQCAESVLSSRKDQRFVLFVDQFEEVFTQVNPQERLAFLTMLTHAASVAGGRVTVVFAMRSDFISNCAAYPALNELLSHEFRQIGAMQPEELVSAIALPAKSVGLPIEDELIARIINDMKGEPGALPLMQFALKELFEAGQSQGGVTALTLKDYLEREGIQKMLARHADATLSQLNAYQQELARSVFSGLIEIGRGRQDTRRTALFDELVPAQATAEDVLAVVQKLADARLIITDEQAGRDTVTISHERLITAWPWLEKLINDNRDVITLQNEIANDAKEWDDHGRDNSYLYTGARLANAREQLQARRLVLSGTAYEFVQAGVSQQKRRQLANRLGIAAIVVILIAAVFVFRLQATTNAQIANTAEAASTEAIAQKATAQAVITLAVAERALAESNAQEAQKQADIALGRQLAAQAQFLVAARNSRQVVADLLAAQSLKILPSSEAAQVLLNNNDAAPLIARLTHEAAVNSVAFSADGKYVASGSYDGTARVWDAADGREVARMTHEAAVNMVAFCPDGKWLVSASEDGTARVWEAATGREIARMTHEAAVASVACSGDGKYVVSGSHDQTARVWEAATGQEIAHLTHASEVVSVAFSPDGRYVVSGTFASTLHVWNVGTGSEVFHKDGPGYYVAFSPNGEYVASGSETTLQLWQVPTGREIGILSHYDVLMGGGGGTAPPDLHLIAFSADSRYIASGGDRTARVWEVSTGREVARLAHDDSVLSVTFSPDGSYLLSGSADNTARVWDLSTGKEVARMTHDRLVRWVAFSPNGEEVVSGSVDQTARLWDAVHGNSTVRRIDLQSPAVFSPDGKLVASVEDGKSIRIWEAATGKDLVRLAHDAAVTVLAFSPDGKYLASGSNDKTARLWEVATGKELARVGHQESVGFVGFLSGGKYMQSQGGGSLVHLVEVATGKEVTPVAYAEGSVTLSPDGKYAMVMLACEQLQGDRATGLTCTKGSVSLIELSTGRELAHITYDTWTQTVRFSPDSRYVVSSGEDGSIHLLQVATGKEIVSFPQAGLVFDITFSADGKYMAMGGWIAAQVIELETGRVVSTMPEAGTVYSLAFSPDGNYLATAGVDGNAVVWQISTAWPVARMAHDNAVRSVAFSPDGKYVVSGSEDHTARVWEATTGREVVRMNHDEPLRSVAFSPDEKYIQSESMEGLTRIWLWRADDLVTAACMDLPRDLSEAEWQQYVGNSFPYQSICPSLPVPFELTPTPAPGPVG